MELKFPREIDDPLQAFFVETYETKELTSKVHNYYEIVFAVSGEADFLINSTTVKMKRGTLVFISKLDTHKLRVTKAPYKRFLLLIKPECFNSIVDDPIIQSFFKQRGNSFNYHKNINEQVFAKLYNAMDRLEKEFNNKEFMWDVSLKHYFNVFLIMFFREYPELFTVNKAALRILDIQNYIDENFHRNITLVDIAKKHYMNPTYLSRIFKETTGMAFKEYLIRIRLNYAKNKLTMTEESVAEIAEKAGFVDCNYFIRVFKKYEGTTPLKFKKNKK